MKRITIIIVFIDATIDWLQQVGMTDISRSVPRVLRYDTLSIETEAGSKLVGSIENKERSYEKYLNKD